MKSFFKTLIKPDWDDNPKRTEILHAANLLQVGEFQLIQLAYKSWYKEEIPENKINKIFSEYMVSEIIPIWVRYYAKDIIKLNNVNVLNSYNDKYHLYDHEFGGKIFNEEHRKKLGIRYAVIIAIVFVLTHYMAIKYVEEAADLSVPYFEKRIIFPELYKDKKN